jgi:hypothetical protein
VRTFQADLTANNLLPAVPAGGLSTWTLYLAFRESTFLTDVMNLQSVTVAGEYTSVADDPLQPVPEPSEIGLFVAGLLAFGGLRLGLIKTPTARTTRGE